jgi:hypothetical protein
MGLAVNVGALAYAIKHDPEGAAHLRDCFATINSLLAVFHISRHQEPEQLPRLQSRAKVTGYPSSYLHHLRRIYARTIKTPGWRPIPVPPGQDAAKDSVFRSSSLKIRLAHLICHSDVEGFYLPLNFAAVIIGGPNHRTPGGPIGSSVQLLQELTSIAPCLGIRMDGLSLSDAEADLLNQAAAGQTDPFWIEKLVWLSLFEAARLSVEYKTAIWFQ